MPNSSCPLRVATARTYTVSVVGPRNSGKSCFCNRFAIPHPDYYRNDHLSVLNNRDISSEIINSESWLYWGRVARQLDDRTVYFRVIEQTEFIDDSTSQPIIYTATEKHQDYLHKSCATNLSSTGKLRYICKEQLGKEDAFEKEYLTPGELEVNGFILVYDVTWCKLSDLSRLSDYCPSGQELLRDFLNILVKSKKPVVLALSKLDMMPPHTLNKLSDTLQRSIDLKRIPLIETSAHQNVNVEQTFSTLFKLIDKQRLAHSEIPRYCDALQSREAELRFIYSNFMILLSQCHPDFLDSWDSFMKRYSQHSDVVSHIALVGTQIAKADFERFAKYREIVARRNKFDRINRALSSVLPNLDPVRNKSVGEVAQYLRNQSQFSDHFVDDKTNGETMATIDKRDQCSSQQKSDNRIPFKCLTETSICDSKSPLESYLHELTYLEEVYMGQARAEAMFHAHLASPSGCTEALRKDDCTKYILPAQPISELQWLWDSLRSPGFLDEDINQVYKQFQCNLHIQAREDFLDLLLERTELFVGAIFVYLRQLVKSSFGRAIHDPSRGTMTASASVQAEPSALNSCQVNPPKLDALCPATDHNSQFHTFPFENFHCDLLSNAPPRGAMEAHLNCLDQQLASDRRHQAMSYLPSERQTLVASYFKLLLPDSTSSCHTYRHQSSMNSQSSMSTDCNVSASSDGLPTYTADPSPSPHLRSLCPALCWGGCVDTLSRYLAYQLLPVNPVCLEPDLISHTEPSRGAPDLRTISSVSPSSTRDSSPWTRSSGHPAVNFRSRTTVPQLWIAVVCVCSDLLAIHAAVHLLSCAGFSMSSLLTSNEQARSPPHRTLFENPTSPSAPLVASASWPLSSARVPSVNRPQRCKSPPSLSSARYDPKQVFNGQIHATFLSLHQVLNFLLADALASTESDLTSAGSTLKDSIVNRERRYDGYLFFLGSANDQNSRSLTTTKGAVPHKPFTSMEQFANDPDDILLTPRPTNDPVFFDNDADAITSNDETAAIYCKCCSLFGICDPQFVGSPHCSCGICCECSCIVQQSTKSSSVPLIRDDSAPSAIAYRPRAWNARSKALRFALSLLPDDCPHQVLLAERDNRPTSIPKVYPTCTSFTKFDECTNQSQSNPKIDVCLDDDDFVSPKPDCLNQPGSNVIDHLLKFFDTCWSCVDRDMSPLSSNTVPVGNDVQLTSHSHQPQSSGSVAPTESFSITRYNPTLASEKSLASGLLHVASATGRRAMHSANVALKKWSSTAKRRRDSGANSRKKTSPTKLSVCSQLRHHNGTVPTTTGPASNRLTGSSLSIGSFCGGSPQSVVRPSCTHSNACHTTRLLSVHRVPMSEEGCGECALENSPQPSIGTDTDCAYTETPLLQRSRLRRSLDRPTAVHRRPSDGCIVSSRGSVSDFSSIGVSTNQTWLSRSHRTWSSQTLTSCVKRGASNPSCSCAMHKLPGICDLSSSLGLPTYQKPDDAVTAEQVIPDPRSVTLLSAPQQVDWTSSPSPPASPGSGLMQAAAPRVEFDVSGDSPAPISQRSPTPERDDESIYEDLDLLFPSSQSSSGSKAPHAPSLLLENSPNTLFQDSESECYDPIDSLDRNCVQRCWCALPSPPLVYYGLDKATNASSERTETDAAAKSSHAGVRTNFVPSRPRERLRSFSTPEGSITPVMDPGGHFPFASVKATDNAPIPNPHFSELLVHSLSINDRKLMRINYSTGDKKVPEPLCHKSSPHMYFGRQSSGRNMEGLSSCLTSCNLSDSGLSERGPALTGHFKHTNHLPLCPQPVSRFHHHHFWHHSDCPHFQLHRPSPHVVKESPHIEIASMDRATLARSLIEDFTNYDYTGRSTRPRSGAQVPETRCTLPPRSNTSLTASSPVLTPYSVQSVLDSTDFPFQRHSCFSASFSSASSRSDEQINKNVMHPTQSRDSNWIKRSKMLNIFGNPWSSGRTRSSGGLRNYFLTNHSTTARPSTRCSPRRPTSIPSSSFVEGGTSSQTDYVANRPTCLSQQNEFPFLEREKIRISQTGSSSVWYKNVVSSTDATGSRASSKL